MTFLPPIPNPITDYDTVMECIRQSQIMATQSNMKYVHIVADVGAAAKFYHVVWNNPVSLGNVIIHLGDMHAMMENFAVAGKFVEGSGFEEIVFHSGLCNSGTIRGLMSGKHYNNAWKVHETVMEALNRLFAQSYMSAELQQFQKFVLDQPDGANVRTALMNSGLLEEMYDSYMNVKAQCLDGAMGKTAQFWLTYIDLICEQMRLHFAINVNDLELRMASWNQSIRNYFPMNKQNYARYGSYYCVLMDNLDKTHPGAKEEIGPSCVSVCRNNYGIGQSIDGGGEQTYTRSSKSQGGIRRFSHHPDTYEKWVLNRPFAATMVDRLLLMADLDMDTDQNHPRKCLRPSQVKHSEILVQNVITTVTECFMNPFDRNLIPDLLYNLVSGKPLSAIATNCLLSAKSRGTELANEFNQRLVHNDDVNTRRFFDPIPRAPWKSFKESDKKVKITSASGKVKDVSVQRDILGMLAAKSAEEGKPIDFRVALTYRLAPVPLALATSDGALRKTVKSKLMDVLDLPTCQTLPSSDSAYTVDVIAEIRSMVGIPNTFRLLAKKLLNGIPNAFRTVYLVCDRYDEASIKNAEHHLRGESRTEYSTLKPDMKIPDFQNFLKNGKNKDQMLELIEQVVVEERDGLGDRIIYFARGEHCTKITATSVLLLDELATDHIEADTKICYMVNHAHSQDDLRQSVVKSPSGDVDIPIILVGNANSQKDILIANGTGKSRKILSVNGSPMDDRQRKAIVGFHALTGNDYVSAFFRKGKTILWVLVKNDNAAMDTLINLGSERHVDNALFDNINRIICLFYRQKNCTSVNHARYQIFWTNYKKGKIVDLSLLPPCESSLRLHCLRANYVAYMWRHSGSPKLEMGPPSENGWNTDFSVKWVNVPYPDNIVELLIDNDEVDLVESMEAITEDAEDDAEFDSIEMCAFINRSM